jgi:hypothetical protein
VYIAKNHDPKYLQFIKKGNIEKSKKTTKISQPYPLPPPLIFFSRCPLLLFICARLLQSRGLLPPASRGNRAPLLPCRCRPAAPSSSPMVAPSTKIGLYNFLPQPQRRDFSLHVSCACSGPSAALLSPMLRAVLLLLPARCGPLLVPAMLRRPGSCSPHRARLGAAPGGRLSSRVAPGSSSDFARCPVPHALLPTCRGRLAREGCRVRPRRELSGAASSSLLSSSRRPYPFPSSANSPASSSSVSSPLPLSPCVSPCASS